MIFVLDTNVLSERTKANPDPAVLAFLGTVPVESIRLSAVVLGESPKALKATLHLS